MTVPAFILLGFALESSTVVDLGAAKELIKRPTFLRTRRS